MRREQIVSEMARRIAEQFRPEKIILFGSTARGDETPDSDVDLLVVVAEAGDRRLLRIAMRQAVRGMGLPKDILVLTSDEFETKRNIPGTLAYWADKEGRAVYAA